MNGVCRERRLEWADQLAPLIKADSEMGYFIDNGERPQTSRLVRWSANVRTVLDAILRNGPDAPKWPEYNALLAERDALRATVAELRERLNCDDLSHYRRVESELRAEVAALREALATIGTGTDSAAKFARAVLARVQP